MRSQSDVIGLVRLCADGQLCLVLSASQFQHILDDTGQTSKAYAGHAGHELSLLSGKRRGMILNELCKKELARLNPNSKIEEPTPGTCCNGARRSHYHSEYDFTMDGRKVECKSAQMSWDKTNKNWRALFHRIKLPWPGVRDRAPFDDLYLTLFSPDSLHIIRHDVRTGVCSTGKRTGSSGHQIFVRGAAGQECWQIARSQILHKFLTKGHCKLVSYVNLSAVEATSWLKNLMEGMTSCQDEAYHGVPLNDMTPRLRGLRIEEIAFEVDQILHQNSSFSRDCSTVDWIRGGVAVEVKHGQMCFVKVRRCWECVFSNIKCASKHVRDKDLFDELWLAIYSPIAIHFFKHPGGKVRLMAAGLKEQDDGRNIVVRGSKDVLGVREALDNMLTNMEEWGCHHVATVYWDNGQ
ncbi:unnamed protein product [Durusdinium trenchii]|uniref:Decapping nuclease n=1 Tax=Durusdinium trenchii TaxID=1381693 RepID=A0ABP0JN09_9DINO